jgi:hypothetical protein
MFKTIFILITLLHGVIHFRGFSRAFGYGSATQLTKNISKPMGMLWFLTGLLFLVCIAFYLLKKDNWVYFALTSVVLSQILIIANWQEARFGTKATMKGHPVAGFHKENKVKAKSVNVQNPMSNWQSKSKNPHETYLV